MKEEIILSICVPTYNRSFYLRRLLLSLLPQCNELSESVEVIVSDNSSSDDTEILCGSYSKKIKNFAYYRNLNNEGLDKNIVNLCRYASGRFIWIVGDDDYLADGALGYVLALLANQNDIDFVYLSPQPHVDGSVYIAKECRYDLYHDALDIIKLVGVNVTFLSAVIVNRRFIPFDVLERYVGTNLNQLGWVLNSLRNGSKFVFLRSKYVIAQQNNTGGYGLFKVFAANFSDIVSDFFPASSCANKLLRLSTMKFLLSFFILNGKVWDSPEKNIATICDSAFPDIPQYIMFYKWAYRFPSLLRPFFLMRAYLVKLRSILEKFIIKRG